MLKCRRASVLFLVLAFVFLVSCSFSQKDLVGRWETEIEDESLGSMSMVYRFTDDGKVYLEQGEGDEISFSIPFGTYVLENEELVIASDGNESVYTFSVSQEELILRQEGEEALHFRRLQE